MIFQKRKVFNTSFVTSQKTHLIMLEYLHAVGGLRSRLFLRNAFVLKRVSFIRQYCTYYYLIYLFNIFLHSQNGTYNQIGGYPVNRNRDDRFQYPAHNLCGRLFQVFVQFIVCRTGKCAPSENVIVSRKPAYIQRQMALSDRFFNARYLRFRINLSFYSD